MTYPFAAATSPPIEGPISNAEVPQWQTSFPVVQSPPSKALPALNVKYSKPTDYFKKFTFPFSDFVGQSNLIGKFQARGHIRHVSIEFAATEYADRKDATAVGSVMAVVIAGPKDEYIQVGGCTSSTPNCPADWYFSKNKIFVQRWPTSWGLFNGTEAVQATRDVSGAHLYSLSPYSWNIFMYFGINSTSGEYYFLPPGNVTIAIDECFESMGDDDNWELISSCRPTLAPTAYPPPSANPTLYPTLEPTFDPTEKPTALPTHDPTMATRAAVIFNSSLVISSSFSHFFLYI